MTTSIKRDFIKYSFFNIFSMIGMSAYILADTLFVANRLGVYGLASLNLAIPVFSFITGTGLMIGMGGSTLFSFNKKAEKRNKIYSQTLFIGLIGSILFFLLGIFLAKEIAYLLGANNQTITMSTTYLRVLLLFAPAFIFNNIYLCFIRNDNNPKLAMIAMLIGSLSNIVLDYILMYPIPLGMFGAALATSLAPIISLVILSLHFIKKKNTFSFTKVKQDIVKIKNILSLGVSFLVNELSSGIVIIFFNLVIISIAGNIGVAAYGVVANLAIIVISIYNGLAQGIQPITSKYYGEKNYYNLKKIFKYTFILSFSIAIVSYIIIFFYSVPIIKLFNSDNNELISMAHQGLLIYFLAFIFIAVNIPMVSFLNSIEKAKHAFIISISRGLVIIVPVLFILSSILGMTGVWLSIVVAELITCFITVFFIKKDFINLNKVDSN